MLDAPVRLLSSRTRSSCVDLLLQLVSTIDSSLANGKEWRDSSLQALLVLRDLRVLRLKVSL